MNKDAEAMTKNYVLSFLGSKGSLPDEEKDKMACEYLDEGILDSMGIVEMVVQFEKEFMIKFTPELMQSEEFRTIGGLIKIIDRLRGNADGETTT